MSNTSTIKQLDGWLVASNTPTLYTFGYLSPRSGRIVSELLAVGAMLVDIRFKPTSRHPEWCYHALCGRYPGNVYVHVPELGNERYKEALGGNFAEPYIKLHDVERGLMRLGRLLDAYNKRVALFCACNTPHCHRFEVARLAHERFGVPVHHL